MVKTGGVRRMATASHAIVRMRRRVVGASVAVILCITALPLLGASPASALGTNETTGGAANTWTNYTNAGGTQGPTIPAFATVQVTCALTGFRVADGNTWWYQIGSAPWNNQYYVSADAFYNNGQTSGSLRGTPFVDPAVPNCASLGGNNETAGGVANTWTDYSSAGGSQGPSVAAHQTIQIACAVNGFRVADGNTWWYQIASAPWNHAYYVSADAFYNNGATSGSLIGTPFVDPAVPLCSGAPGGGSSPTVTLAQGPVATAGYRYAVTASGFPVGTTLSVVCYDSVSPNGFYTFGLTMDGNGSGFTQSQCFSGDGPDHWVVVNGRISSNHVTWAAGSGGTPLPSSGDVYTFTNGRGAATGGWVYSSATPAPNCSTMSLDQTTTSPNGVALNGPIPVDTAPVSGCFAAARGSAGSANVGGSTNASHRWTRDGSTAYNVQNFGRGVWGKLIIMGGCARWSSSFSSVCVTPSTAAFVIRGGIWQAYANQDGVHRLGLPIGNEVASGDGGAIQLFEGGMIAWSQARGGRVVLNRPASTQAQLSSVNRYSCNADSKTTDLGYAGQNCTYFAAFRLAADGHGIPYGDGNAKEWPASLGRAAGTPVLLSNGVTVSALGWPMEACGHLTSNSTCHARPGDIAIRVDGAFGHVVYIDSVASNFSVTIEDYNRDNRCSYNRTVGIDPNKSFDYVIHPPVGTW